MKRIVRYVDPPGGWRYGFPKVYDGPGQIPTDQWLLDNGYPQHELDNGGHYIRMWTEEIEEPDNESL